MPECPFNGQTIIRVTVHALRTLRYRYIKLDGCIVWNAHNTVLGEEALVIYIVLVTVTGTAGVKESLLGLDSWIAADEEVSLQTASEGGKRRCRRDGLRQTVPDTGCSDWKGPVAES